MADGLPDCAGDCKGRSRPGAAASEADAAEPHHTRLCVGGELPEMLESAASDEWPSRCVPEAAKACPGQAKHLKESEKSGLEDPNAGSRGLVRTGLRAKTGNSG